MALWVVRAGQGGRYGDIALDENIVGIGWTELGDLNRYRSRDEIVDRYREIHPDFSPNQIGNGAGQIWAFLSRINVGDFVVLPITHRSVIAIGRITGEHRYRPDLPDDLQQARSVEWLRIDIPRSAFDQDLLYSLGTALTVAQIRRNNAEERIKALIENRTWQPPVESLDADEDTSLEAETSPIDLEEYAREQIQSQISRRFKGHDFSDLITAILNAQGYTTDTSTPGRDGGVDIIAGTGSMGFDPPRLVVQVKSSEQPLDVVALRELRGVIRNFGADQGLLVSWGGFRQSVPREARQSFFEIRLWGPEEILNALFTTYDRLPDELRSEIPLKRVWTLVSEE